MENLQPKIGDHVRVRQRTWVVQDVEPHDTCRLVTLCGQRGDGQPQVWRVLQPFDDIEPARTRRGARRVGARAWSNACARLLQEHGGAASLRTAATAHVDVLPYQLEPALAFLRGLGPRVLIADEVGLGKTIQALLCATEMRARGLASRVLVLCPAGLREQWVEEARTRVGLDLVLFDQPALRRLASRLPPDVNPWCAESCVVSSIDFVKRADVLPSALAAGWDLLIVDEAHGSCGVSDRRDAVSRLAVRAPFLLLLTATPHSGDEDGFAALCNLGAHDDALVVFRRSRLEAGRDSGRRVHRTRVVPTTAERHMHAALAAFTRAVHRERRDTDRHVWLLLSLLHKRALSSPFALAASAERRLELLDQQPEERGMQLMLPLDDENGELDAADAAPMWHVPALGDLARERRLLQRVVDAAREAESRDAKLLRRLLAAIREPVIVFTEYRDTLQHVRLQVAPDAALIHGGMTREQRRHALDTFERAGVLLATDAAGEGLNLQHHCRVVINLELPWNPMRLEQRIGRVDRIGQRRRVHVFHLIAEGTGETRLIDRLSARVAQADARVGAPNPLAGRPEWTEDTSARLVVLCETRSVPAAPLQVPPVPLTRLVDEGEHEAARLRLVRALARRANPRSTPPHQILIARVRHRRLRAEFGRRTLLVYRTVVVDGAGRPIASHVSGVLADPAIRKTPPGEDAAAMEVAHAARIGHDASIAIHRQLTAVRLRRARSIAASLAERPGEQQPGLFDRRNERQLRERTLELTAARSMADDRVHRVEIAARTSVTTPELLLVLEPRRP